MMCREARGAHTSFLFMQDVSDSVVHHPLPALTGTSFKSVNSSLEVFNTKLPGALGRVILWVAHSRGLEQDDL